MMEPAPATERHRMRKLSWAMRVRTDEQAREARRLLHAQLDERLVPALVHALDEASSAGQVLKIPRLHLHLCFDSLEHASAELSDRLYRELLAALRGLMAEHRVQSVPASEDRRDQLWHYLDSGSASTLSPSPRSEWRERRREHQAATLLWLADRPASAWFRWLQLFDAGELRDSRSIFLECPQPWATVPDSTLDHRREPEHIAQSTPRARETAAPEKSARRAEGSSSLESILDALLFDPSPQLSHHLRLQLAADVLAARHDGERLAAAMACALRALERDVDFVAGPLRLAEHRDRPATEQRSVELVKVQFVDEPASAITMRTDQAAERASASEPSPGQSAEDAAPAVDLVPRDGDAVPCEARLVADPLGPGTRDGRAEIQQRVDGTPLANERREQLDAAFEAGSAQPNLEQSTTQLGSDVTQAVGLAQKHDVGSTNEERADRLAPQSEAPLGFDLAREAGPEKSEPSGPSGPSPAVERSTTRVDDDRPRNIDGTGREPYVTTRVAVALEDRGESRENAGQRTLDDARSASPVTKALRASECTAENEANPRQLDDDAPREAGGALRAPVPGTSAADPGTKKIDRAERSNRTALHGGLDRVDGMHDVDREHGLQPDGTVLDRENARQFDGTVLDREQVLPSDGTDLGHRDSPEQTNPANLARPATAVAPPPSVFATPEPTMLEPASAPPWFLVRSSPEVPTPVLSAGLVLLHPFLPALFTRLRLALPLPGPLDPSARAPAAALLHFLATGEDEPLELELGLIKLLLGLRPDTPLPVGGGLVGQTERDEALALLAAVIQHWSALRSTSIDGLRTTFLRRFGLVREVEGGDRLQVEPSPFDVLLDRLPWGLGVVKLPWMASPLFTEWASA
jgi:hypothetical protein